MLANVDGTDIFIWATSVSPLELLSLRLACRQKVNDGVYLAMEMCDIYLVYITQFFFFHMHIRKCNCDKFIEDIETALRPMH